MSAATGFTSTAADLVRYIAAHRLGDERLLTDASKRLQQRAAWQSVPDKPESARYGLGMALDDIAGRRVIGHSGGLPRLHHLHAARCRRRHRRVGADERHRRSRRRAGGSASLKLLDAAPRGGRRVLPLALPEEAGRRHVADRAVRGPLRQRLGRARHRAPRRPAAGDRPERGRSAGGARRAGRRRRRDAPHHGGQRFGSVGELIHYDDGAAGEIVRASAATAA